MVISSTAFAVPVVGGASPNEGITFILGETWEILLTPRNGNGIPIPLTGVTASLRVATGSTLVADVQGAVPDNGCGFLFALFAAEQADAGFIAGAPYRFEIQITTPGGITSTQSYGPFYVQPSLFAAPFPPTPAVRYTLDFSWPGNFSFNASIGVL